MNACMPPPANLAHAACRNARFLLARVLRSIRRSGHFADARSLLQNARALGTYPATGHPR